MSVRVGSNGPDVRCLDCHMQLLPLGRQPASQWFQVLDAVWDQSGLGPFDGCLCVRCLERRLGRPLDWRDLDPDAGPINQPTETDAPRLAALKLAAAAG